MSFSTTIKNELCRMETSGDCCPLAELAAVIRIGGTVKALDQKEANVRMVTENAAFARRIFSLVKGMFHIYPEVIIRKSKKLKKHVTYVLIIPSSLGATVLQHIGIDTQYPESAYPMEQAFDIRRTVRKTCCKRAYLRGAFLAGGSVSDPEKTYHLEIANHTHKIAVEIIDLMNHFDLNAKIVKRKGSFVTYLKEGENIVDFLNIIGAHSALLELENIRILKEMRNNVNRIVNCETANLDKTISAAFRQVENIKYIRDHIGFEKLPKSLREVAEMRLVYTDINLKELGALLNPPLGKSGVNHRLRKLDKIAQEDKELKGEI